MVDLDRSLRNLVSAFTVKIQGIARGAAISMLDSAMPAAPASREPAMPAAPMRRARSTRGKRSPLELEEIAERFVKFVAANPGLRIEQIKTQIDATTRELELPIRKLIARGAIVTKGRKRTTTYYLGKQ